MSTQLQFRRGTAAQTATFVGAAGEVTADTDNKTLHLHDGVTAGGSAMATATQLAAEVARAQAAELTALGDNGRNLLMNGLFNISQRTGPWTVTGYTFDRWLMVLVGDAMSLSQVAPSDADRTAIGDEAVVTALQAVVTGAATAANLSLITQRIENVRLLGGKTVTVSFWAKASAALNLGAYISQIFGTGGSPSAQVNVAPTTFALTTVWTRFTATIVIPSTSGKILGTNGDSSTSLTFGFSSGTTNAATSGTGAQTGTFELWGVQLEIGSVVTSVGKRTIGTEMNLCQRFYQTGQMQWSGAVTAAVPVAISAPPPVVMRAVPTMVLATNFSSNMSAPTLTSNGVSYGVSAVPTATGAGSINILYSASADL